MRRRPALPALQAWAARRCAEGVDADRRLHELASAGDADELQVLALRAGRHPGFAVERVSAT
ncbi:MAG: hypothetical protein JKY65_09920 [Planctomycetes bacterium]|nr:hypothetical protein [Planctomycetota bacterium]